MVFAAGGTAITAFWMVVGLGVLLAWWSWHSEKRAAHTSLPWYTRGLALSVSGLSGALIMGVSGMVGFWGYDGLLYGIGMMGGWFVGNAAVAGPMGRLSPRGTLLSAVRLRAGGSSAGRALAAAALVVCVLLLAAEVIAAGALLRQFLGGQTAAAAGFPWWTSAGGLVALMAAMWPRAAGTTGAGISGTGLLARALVAILMLAACGMLAGSLWRQKTIAFDQEKRFFSTQEFRQQLVPGDVLLTQEGPWSAAHLLRVKHADGSVSVWRFWGMDRFQLSWDAGMLVECEVVGRRGTGVSPGGFVARPPMDVDPDQPDDPTASPVAFLRAVQNSDLGVPREVTVVDGDGMHRVFYPAIVYGEGLLVPGGKPGLFDNLMEAGRDGAPLKSKVNLVSLMLALLAGGAAVAGVVPRPRQASDAPAAAVATPVVVVATAALVIVGLGALVQGRLDPSDSNRTAALAAGAIGSWVQVIFCLVGLAVIVLTMRGLLRGAAEALGGLGVGSIHESQSAELSAMALAGVAALVMGTLLQRMNAAFVAGWALNIAAAAFVPALAMVLLVRGASARGVAVATWVGLVGSVIWILLTPDAYEFLYGMGTVEGAQMAKVPWNQPAIVMVPAALVVLLAGRLAVPVRVRS